MILGVVVRDELQLRWDMEPEVLLADGVFAQAPVGQAVVEMIQPVLAHQVSERRPRKVSVFRVGLHIAKRYLLRILSKVA